MNKKLVFILCFISLVAGYYLIIQEHILEDPVFHYSSVAGNLDLPFSYENAMKYPNDYYMLLTYESTGAFMAGREISVSADFTAVHKIQTLQNSHIWVVFPGALNVPITNDQDRQNDASV